MDRSSLSKLALLLLAVGASRHYGWAIFPDEIRGVASKGLGAFAALWLLWIVVYLTRAAAVLAVVIWWSFEELQVVLCTAWYAVDPWPVEVGQAMCSAKAGFDLGAVGIMVVGVLLWRLHK